MRAFLELPMRSSVSKFGRSIALPCFALLFSAVLGIGQSGNVAGKPTEPPAATAKPSDIAKEALVFDQLETRIRLEPDGTGSRQVTARVRVLADAGVKAMAVPTFTYTASNQQVDIAYVRVKKPDGTVVTTPDYNIQDLPADATRAAPMYSDIHQKHVAVRGLGVGDTLEYQVTFRTLKPEVQGQFWLEYSFEKNLIVLNELLDLDLPADKAVTVASADVQPVISTTGGRKLYHWESRNLARPDPDAPPKSTKHQKPSVQVTTFSSWEQVGAWYQSLQKDAVAVTPAIQARADALTKGMTSDADKLQAIFDDVALHIHYVGLDFGIGRYQPHEADDVLANEYGDCKDKHTLLAALLHAEGIEAWPILISSTGEIDPATPSPAQFDHVITLVPLNGKTLWMDSTEEVAPIGTLMATLRDKQVLAIPPGKAAYLEHTASDLPYLQDTHFDVEGKLSDKGVFTGHFDEKYHGDAEMIVRSAFRAVPQSQWKELVQRFSNATGFGGEVKEPQVSPVEQIEKALEFSFDYTREKYGDWENRRISPPMPPFGYELAPGVKEVKPADDVDLGSPGSEEFHTVVHLPAGWTIVSSPGVDVTEDWAEYHSKYTFKDGSYVADRQLIVKKNKMPLDQWEKYLAFRRSMYEDESRMTPLMGANGPSLAGAAIPFGPRGFDPNPDGVRREIYDSVSASRDALNLLARDAPASADGAAKAVDLSNKNVTDIESKTQSLKTEDMHSLYWGQALACAWSTRGWAALEAHDLKAAESYLRAAWRLGQDRLTGYQLGRMMEAQGNRAAAIHQYQLAQATGVQNPLDADSTSGYNVEDHLAASYKKLTGRDIDAPSLNHGEYNGSLRAELDNEEQVKQLTKTSKLTGSGLFVLAFEAGKPAKATPIHGDKGMEVMAGTLQAHAFGTVLPAGSKAKLLREVRIVCTPWAGCDAYLLLPTSIQFPSIDITPAGAPKGIKTVRIEMQPQ